MIKNLLKNALFGAVVCMAAAGAAGSWMHANVAGSPTGAAVSGEPAGDNSGPGKGTVGGGEAPRCILFINTCPADNPLCGKEALQMTVGCLDAACAKGTCVPVSTTAPQSDPNPAVKVNGCFLRQFGCAKDAGSSCYKRWRSSAISCTSGACGGGACITSDAFFSTYSLQPWDLGQLQGPFPHSETMCMIQKSLCDPNAAACLNPVSLEQIACDDKQCVSGLCLRSTVQVDQNDTIVGPNPAGTTVSGDSGNKGSGKQETVVIDVGGNAQNDDENTKQGSGDSETTTTVAANAVRVLGCFDDSGTWTTDRSKCAAPSKPSSGQPDAAPREEDTVKQKIVERTIETTFIPDTRKNTLVQNILSSTVEASGRLSSLIENPSIPDDLRQKAEDTLEKLRITQRDASVPDLSVRDLQKLADDVSLQLTSVQEGVSAWHKQVATDVPAGVTDKLDKIYRGMPSVFGVLLQEGIPVDASVISQYTAARDIYTSVHDACVMNTSTCGNLSKAIDALDPVFTGIKQALEKTGRTDLEQRMDELLK